VRSIAVDSSDTEEAVTTNHGAPEGQGTHHITIPINSKEDGTPVFKPVEHGEVKWNGTIVVEPLESSFEMNDSDGLKANTVSAERHLKMKLEKERNNKPNLVISDVASDPLDAKRRFLERMNLAHALNARTHRPAVQKEALVTAPEVYRERAHTRAIPHTPHTASQASGKHARHRLFSYAMGAIATAGLVFLISSTFLESTSEYKAATGEHTSVFHSTFRVSSLESAAERLSERISGIRLLSQISLF
jgi:hypothetical protein